MPIKRLSTANRQAIFAALVAAQDKRTMTIEQSRLHIRAKFDISDYQLRAIEIEGVNFEWPPLGEVIQPVLAQP